MNTKTVAVAVLAVAALAVATYILMGQPEPAPEQDPWSGREPAYIEDFAGSVASASHIYIMMDLRGAAEGRARTNIMQCGVDLASSTAIGGIPKTFYSMDSECIKSLDDGTTVSVPAQECLAEIDAARDAPGGAIFYVRKANETLIFWNELVVGMGDEYSLMGCSVNAAGTSSGNTTGAMAFVSQLNRTGNESEAPANSTQ